MWQPKVSRGNQKISTLAVYLLLAVVAKTTPGVERAEVQLTGDPTH